MVPFFAAGPGIDVVFADAGDDVIVLLGPCELDEGKFISGGDGFDRVRLPVGLSLQELEAAGVVIDADVEVVETSDELPEHHATCE